MLKKMSIRKIMISSIALFALFLIYLIPKEENIELKNINQELEYVDKEVNKSEIYLLDKYNMLARTMVVTDKNVETKAKELLEILIKGGKGENKVPNGFKSLLPSDTKILSLSYTDGVIKVNFSKDLLDVSAELEERLIEAIVYTLTSIDEVKYIVIYVDGDILNKLPQSKINLPATLDRSFGINKEYNFSSIDDINQVTVYYINKHENDTYYVPVTKYINDEREKVNIIVDELSSTNNYNTNLMSYLNGNAKLLKVENVENGLELNFNNYLYSDADTKNILEEVIYTISLSVKDNYDVNEVIFQVEDEEIYKTVLKTIE